MPPGQAPPALRRANAATVANRAAPNTAMVVAAGICECAVNANTSSTTGGADRMTYRLGVSDLSTPSGHGPERRPPAELGTPRTLATVSPVKIIAIALACLAREVLTGQAGS